MSMGKDDSACEPAGTVIMLVAAHNVRRPGIRTKLEKKQGIKEIDDRCQKGRIVLIRIDVSGHEKTVADQIMEDAKSAKNVDDKIVILANKARENSIGIEFAPQLFDNQSEYYRPAIVGTFTLFTETGKDLYVSNSVWNIIGEARIGL
jgi:hypothetical protein